MSRIFEELLEKDGRLVYKTRGASMRPMLYQDRDLVVIEVPNKKPEPYDVVLYKRNDQYILHRIVSAEGDFFYILGDNTFSVEKVPIKAILGVLTAFVRKGKQYSVTDRRYQLYCRTWRAIYPLRIIYNSLRTFAGRLARRMGIRK